MDIPVKDSNGRTHVVHWKEQPYDCLFFDFENSTFRQTFPVFRLDPEKEELARQYVQTDQFVNELNLLSKDIAAGKKPLLSIEKDEFLRKLKVKEEFRQLFSRLPKEMQEALFSGSEAQFCTYYVREGMPVAKPFLTDDMIKVFLDMCKQKKYIPQLFEGDIIHVPFSKAEVEVLEATSVIDRDNLDQICSKLPGRTGKDVLRFLEHQRKYADSSAPAWTMQPIVYSRTTCFQRDAEAKSSSFTVVAQREHRAGRGLTPARQRTIFVKSLMRRLTHKGSTTDPTDAIVDVRLDPTGTTAKLVVGTVRHDTNAAYRISMMYDLSQGTCRIFNEHTATVSGSAFSIDGQYIITCSYDKNVIVRSSYDGTVQRFLGRIEGEPVVGHLNEEILNMTLHHKKANVIATWSKQKVFVWNILTGRSIWGLQPNADTQIIIDMTFGRTLFADYLFAGTETVKHKGELQIWDVNSGHSVGVILERNSGITSIGTNEGPLLVYSAADVLRLFDIRNHRQPVLVFKTLQKDVNVVSFRCEYSRDSLFHFHIPSMISLFCFFEINV
jgi:hypothetical protein